MLGEHIPWNLPNNDHYPTKNALLNDLIVLARNNLPAADYAFALVYGVLDPKVIIVEDCIQFYGGFRRGDAKRARRFYKIRKYEDGTWGVEYWGYDYDNQWS